MDKLEMAIDYLSVRRDASSSEIAQQVGCSKRTARRARQKLRETKNHGKNQVKILIVDIETSPMEIYVWGLFKQRPTIHQIKKEWSVLSWSAKWLYDGNIMSQVVTPEEAVDRTEASIIHGIWELLDEADIVIGHNAKSFDVRKLNAKFLKYGYGPPMSYYIVDTKNESQRYFAHTSHKLEYLAEYIGVIEKDPQEYSLWKRCVSGDARALKQMETYNKRDVKVTEEVYTALRPWIKSHPNLGLYYKDITERVCPNCASTELKKSGVYYTPAGRYQSYRCICGAICRERIADLTTDERAKLLLSVAR